MTLGGLALSVGILVDQAIVTIENIERHLHAGTELHEAIIVGAGEIGVPAFVATLCICIVFVPMFFLSGVARFLFVPMAMAVVFAMIASYILSRTLVPTLVMLLMGGAHAGRRSGRPARCSASTELRRAVRARARTPTRSTLVGAPRKRGGLRARVPRLHRRCRACSTRCSAATSSRASTRARSACTSAPPTGTRIEETARIADAVEAAIRELIPKDQLETILDNLGVPNSSINLAVQQLRRHRHVRRRDPDVAAGRPPPDRGVRDAAARRAAEALPGHRVLLPARRHRHADPQLRPARGDRRPVLRPEHGAATPRSPPSSRSRSSRSRARSTCTCTSGSTIPAVDLQMDRSRLQQVGLDRVQRRAERAGRRSPAASRPRPRSGSTRRTASSTRSRCRRRSTASTRSTRCSTSRSAEPARRGAGQRHDAAPRQPGRGEAGRAACRRLALQHHARRSTST